jgi:copper(I)-binding protein
LASPFLESPILSGDMVPAILRGLSRPRIRRDVLSLALIVAISASAHTRQPVAAAGQARALSATDGRVKPSADKSAATVYAVLTTPTMYDVYFTSASTDVAGRVEFREVSGDKPPQAVKHITVPAYEALELGSRGASLELLELKKPLAEGQAVAITLTTDQGIAVQLSAVVQF